MSVTPAILSCGQPLVLVASRQPRLLPRLPRTLVPTGWDVRIVRSGTEIRDLARRLRPAVIALDADLPDESGWLTCAKLTAELPGVKVVLLSPHPTARAEQFARFTGAVALLDSEKDQTLQVERLLLADPTADLHAVRTA